MYVPKKLKSAPAAFCAVLALSLTVVFGLWLSAEQRALAAAEQRFDRSASEAVFAIEQRLLTYKQALQSLVALADTPEAIDQTIWSGYVERRALADDLPGFRGIGLSLEVTPDALPRLIQQQQARGMEGLRVWPIYPRERYVPLVYVAPKTESNLAFLGYDMYSEPTRRRAMDYARETGRIGMTSAILTRDDEGQYHPTIFLFLPLSATDADATEIRGFVSGSFRVEGLMKDVFRQPGLRLNRLEIFDAETPQRLRRVYDSQHDNPDIDQHTPAFNTDMSVSFGGQDWLLRFSSLPAFEQRIEPNLPKWFLIAGILFSISLASFIALLANSRGRARVLMRMNLSLQRESHRRQQLTAELRQFFSISPDILCTLAPDGTFRQVNPAAEHILRKDTEMLEGTYFIESLHPDDREACQGRLQKLLDRSLPQITLEARSLTANNEVCWIEWSFVAVDWETVFYGYGRDITDRKIIEHELHHNAFHDKLTGVNNRSVFIDRLDQLIKRSRRRRVDYAIMVMDIDNFKTINDSYGHLVGDALLQEFAKRIERQLRPEDTLSRFGGDEFMLLIEDTCNEEDLRGLARRILAALQEPFVIKSVQLVLGSSIGIALGGAHYTNTDDIIRHADLALYRAKDRGKGCYVIFDEKMQCEQVNRSAIEQALRETLQRQGMGAAYQPIIEVAPNRIVGCEVLARWHHDDLGEVEPAQFISVAESSGLIVQLGRQMLTRACRTLANLRASNLVSNDFYMSVNLSPKEFFLVDLVDYIRITLAQFGLSGRHLAIEITEGVLIERDDEAAAVFNELQAMGVRIYVDDFGTGYSSLSYLRRLPIDGIKLDRSFINQTDTIDKNQKIVRAILELARVLKLESVVEGVETDQQRAFVFGLGFGYAQGFGIHRPLNNTDLVTLLRREQSPSEDTE
ncbi:bifunctional diguanylate cyclase/phosphodiesterase [Marinimicrobium alkaliphilum]|uniref:bifunctional diguanylate cyclase/phosphodiesterase n=1 Tax=Marinimicrobium alkaliphilum TaxID=2202654 RepID=UPI000DB930AC|nr:EAL domain-containing protein [Marinimicrobium alkaliphilum]